MPKKKQQLFTVTAVPYEATEHPYPVETDPAPDGQEDSVINRALVRVTQVFADTPEDAISIVEETERRLEQDPPVGVNQERYDVVEAVESDTK